MKNFTHYNVFKHANTTTFQTTKQNPLTHFIDKFPNRITMDQCHEDTIAIITDPNTVHNKTIPKTDAVITTLPNLLLLVKTADCLPILIYHPYPLIAAIHAGRKGTDLEIFKKTLYTLNHTFGVEKDLSVWFGPHICEECYEINPKTKEHYNLYIKNKSQLLKTFNQNRFEFYDARKCTVVNNEEFHSYRKENTVERNYSAIQINT